MSINRNKHSLYVACHNTTHGNDIIQNTLNSYTNLYRTQLITTGLNIIGKESLEVGLELRITADPEIVAAKNVCEFMGAGNFCTKMFAFLL